MMSITRMNSEQYPAIADIYRQGILTENATFQTDAPSWEEWDSSHLKHSRIALLENDIVKGWAALTPVSGRCVYAGVAEVSVYVHADSRGKGYGKKLLEALISESEKNSIWTLQAGVFPENTASIQIHEQLGFRKIGIREKIGKMNGKWRDTVLLERRSTTVGIN